jgi:hypothetical protein
MVVPDGVMSVIPDGSRRRLCTDESQGTLVGRPSSLAGGPSRPQLPDRGKDPGRCRLHRRSPRRSDRAQPGPRSGPPGQRRHPARSRCAPASGAGRGAGARAGLARPSRARRGRLRHGPRLAERRVSYGRSCPCSLACTPNTRRWASSSSRRRASRISPRGEADIGIRIVRSASAAIVSKLLGRASTGLFASREYVERRLPNARLSRDVAGQHDWVGLDASLARLPQEQWIRRYERGVRRFGMRPCSSIAPRKPCSAQTSSARRTRRTTGPGAVARASPAATSECAYRPTPERRSWTKPPPRAPSTPCWSDPPSA